MPMTNFPNGFLAGLSVRGLPLLQTHPGNIFWVNNAYTSPGGGPSHSPQRTVAGSDSNPGTFQRPFATIAFALSQCVQGRGDIILVGPGHVETVNGAGTTTSVTDPTGSITVSNGTTIALNVANVAIIGLGSGSFRPTLIFNTATTANVPVRSANMSLQNFVVKNNFAAIASNFTGAGASVTASISGSVMNVTAVGSGTLYPGAALVSTTAGFIPNTIIVSQLTGTTGGVGTYRVSVSQTVVSGTITSGPQDFNLESCEFRDVSSVLNGLTAYTDSGNANCDDGFRFKGNKIFSLGTTAATTAVKATAGQDRWALEDNFGVWAILNNTAALLAGGANNLTNLSIGRNVVRRPNTSNTGGLLMSSSSTGCTGHMYDNYVHCAAGTVLMVATGTGLGFSQNFGPATSGVDHSGVLLPSGN